MPGFMRLFHRTARPWTICLLAIGSVSGGLHAQPNESGSSAAASNDAKKNGGDSAARAAPPSKARCVEAHQQMQQMQNANRLIEARNWARTCVHHSCPGPIVTDCAQWMSELDRRLPSVVFQVRLDGHHCPSATVVVDGTRVRDWTRGEALVLNPGEHHFRFELPSYPPVDESMLVTEGMRYRLVSADFETPAPEAASAPSPTTAGNRTPASADTRRERSAPDDGAASAERPIPASFYALLGLSAAGFVTFGGLAMAGKAEQTNLEKTCSPRCTDDDMARMRQFYLLGDLGLGVGAAALIGAGVVYLTRPVAAPEPTPTSVSLGPLPGGGMATITRHF